MSVTAAQGFEAAGVASGIKDSGAPDLALVATASRRAVPAAGVFTTNRVQAAPVLVSNEHLADGRAAAVVLNSGNANAATGAPGRSDALRMCELAGDVLGVAASDVLVCSTGLIGPRLPMAPIEAGIPLLQAALSSSAEAGAACGDAMLTTDTVRKEAVRTFEVDGATVTVGGVAKGAAMLAPSLATMLAVVTTDAAVSSRALGRVIAEAARASFNRIVVDGSRSTNDTVLMLASGEVAMTPIEFADGKVFHKLLRATTEVCRDLAIQMVRDAEGATKFALVAVRGARTHDDAVLAAQAVASSQLVQCSVAGEDPYWGRVLSEIGASGADVDPDTVEILYNHIAVCRQGTECEHDAAELAESMTAREVLIECDLHLGHGEAAVFFSDLTHAYIDENMGTS